jgi:class 3 adenylate cyclase
VNEIAVLGNAANLTARLSSKAAKGEVLISKQTAVAAQLSDPALERRRLKLKGLSKTVPVRVLTVKPQAAS